MLSRITFVSCIIMNRRYLQRADEILKLFSMYLPLIFLHNFNVSYFSLSYFSGKPYKHLPYTTHFKNYVMRIIWIWKKEVTIWKVVKPRPIAATWMRLFSGWLMLPYCSKNIWSFLCCSPKLKKVNVRVRNEIAERAKLSGIYCTLSPCGCCNILFTSWPRGGGRRKTSKTQTAS